jgi:hypothetical protein
MYLNLSTLNASKKVARSYLNRLPLKVSGLMLVFIATSHLFMHSAILFGALSTDFIWGGHVEENVSPWVIISLLLNGCTLFVGISYLWTHSTIKRVVAVFHLPLAWFLVGNTLFNLILLPSFEGILGTPLCALLAIGLWRGMPS